MKNLILCVNPNPKSFCHAIMMTATETLTSKGHDVVVRDLYDSGFDPVLTVDDFEAVQTGTLPTDVKAEQKHITWADVVILIYPNWWSGPPAMMKGYFDRVYTHGFAYNITEKGIGKLLTGKKVVIFTPQGASKEFSDSSGMFDAMRKTTDTGIFEMCGMEVLEHAFFPSVPYVDDAARKGYLLEVKDIIERL